MLEDHVKARSTCRRLRASAGRCHIDAFVQSLVATGYSRVTVVQTCHFLTVAMEGIPLAACDTALAEGLIAYITVAPHQRGHESESTAKRARRAAKRLLEFLVREGVVSPRRLPRDDRALLGAFHAWSLRQRGLAETTLRLYEGVLVDLLDEVGDDPSSWTARSLREFVVERSRPHGRRRGETIVCAVRAFLRFLVATGKCPDGMPDAIPRFASWKLSSLPRYLEPSDVQRVIQASSPTTAVRRRDRAILLLLSRLGLRAGDIGRIAFEDINWRDATLAVSGKSRRRERLPLPQDVGDAILDYVQNGRPLVRRASVFVTARAPYRPITNAAVSQLARAAISRAGVESPSHGAHVFRHSAATAMLRDGANLACIGAVLRHRHPDTTLLYAKVDFDSLVEVALPWPEALPC